MVGIADLCGYNQIGTYINANKELDVHKDIFYCNLELVWSMQVNTYTNIDNWLVTDYLTIIYHSHLDFHI